MLPKYKLIAKAKAHQKDIQFLKQSVKYFQNKIISDKEEEIIIKNLIKEIKLSLGVSLLLLERYQEQLDLLSRI